MKMVLVVGSANMDMVVRVKHLPQAGETVLGGEFQQVLGGKGANQAVAAQRSGAQVIFMTCLGDDVYGQQALSAYQQEGIDISAVEIVKSVASGVALIIVDEQGENSIAVASGANLALSAAHIDKHHHLLQQAAIVVLQCEISLERIAQAVSVAKQYEKTVILNPAPAMDLPEALLARIDILTPNATEASYLTRIAVNDVHSAQSAAENLLQRGVKTVIITLGGQGVYWATAEQQQHFSAFPILAVDTTAAGDTFTGALAASLVQGLAMPDAIRFCQAAAALAVSQAGAQPSIPHKPTIEEFLLTYTV